MTIDPHDGPHVTMRQGRVLQSEDGTFFSNYSPAVAGFLRSLTQAVIAGGLTAAITFFEAGPEVPESMVVMIPVIIVVLRTLEGLIDKQSVEE